MTVSDLVLTHYDPNLPLQLACDASPAERNYAQIDKEALATVWGVKKFHNYLFGTNFTLLTDYEPLTSIFHPSKSLPAVTAARLQRYALFLAGFDYTIRYKNTKLHGNADGLSRLPLHSETTEEGPDPVGLFYATQFEPLPVTAEQVKRETQRDPLLVKVHELVMKGCSTPQDEAIKPFYQRKDELTVHCGVLMLGHRAVIPAKLRNQVLTELHEGHLDAHSKWPEVEIMPSTTSTQTIDRLRTIFARYGVPAQVVTDNGPQFTSAEFQLFLKTNGIKHITTAPFHPATNGQAERFVQSSKHAMKCEKQSASQLKTNMAKFLLAYRNTPHSTTGESPSVLFWGRPLRTRLDLVKPDLQRKVMNRQIDQAGRKGHSPTSIGQTVMARNYSGKDKWLPGIVRAQTGPLSYEIKVGPNRIWRRHIDQLRASSVKVNDQSGDTADPHPELGEAGQNIAPAEEIVAEPDIELATNPPVVQQQEAGRATTGSE
ncbi:PREDICTED: LOW QUALITY PROTEIN: uncharacterized protein K02A2.6-like [Paramuricea clavata]|uniref:PREDICTED: LOW QUALITY PROTEIN: uncharacterized protein K02A2.6-like n=1 Tax=Paramuricea clavata TaxID=317549 RepID=A0A6S7JKF2_PARCT|nr:PREDICTED: LOW QUALITY PROTEIN: uncharacterized protein K02A2.6-like [Paramuricea clavata]